MIPDHTVLEATTLDLVRGSVIACWLMTVVAFILTWIRDLRLHALIALWIAVALGFLAVSFHAIRLIFGQVCYECCVAGRWWLLDGLQTLWTPILLAAIPVLLRVPREKLDRFYVRVALSTGIISVDAFIVAYGGAYAASLACGNSHGTSWLFGM